MASSTTSTSTPSLETSNSNKMMNTQFHIKRQSPTAHLQILRNPTTYNQSGSPYFSPGLGNASETWLRHRANEYRKKRLLERRMSYIRKLDAEEGKMASRFDDAQIDYLREELDPMESLNRSWVLNIPSLQREVARMREEIEDAREDKIDITERLEDLMEQDGRSLREYTQLREAAEKETQTSDPLYWPTFYDSDSESDENEEQEEEDEEESNDQSQGSSKIRYASARCSSIEDESDDGNDADDESDASDASDDNEDDRHLYDFPLPITSSTNNSVENSNATVDAQHTVTATTSTQNQISNINDTFEDIDLHNSSSTNTDTIQPDNNIGADMMAANLTQEQIVQILKPVAFDWSDEEEDGYEPPTATEQLPAPETFALDEEQQDALQHDLQPEAHIAEMLKPNTFDWGDEEFDKPQHDGQSEAHIINNSNPNTNYIEEEEESQIDHEAETHSIQTLKPDTFDWGDESNDEDAQQCQQFANQINNQSDIIELYMLSAEDRFVFMVNEMYDALDFDLYAYREACFMYQRYQPGTLKAMLEPVEMGNGNRCTWIVHPLAFSKKNLNPPLDGIPTLRLTTPGGQLCWLEEAHETFEGPEWDRWFQQRREKSLEVESRLLSMETLEDREKRENDFAYWEQIKNQEWDDYIDGLFANYDEDQNNEALETASQTSHEEEDSGNESRPLSPSTTGEESSAENNTALIPAASTLRQTENETASISNDETAVEKFEKFQTILASNIQKITKWSRDKQAKEEEEAAAAKWASRQERYSADASVKIGKSLIMLALRAHEDGLVPAIDTSTSTIYFAAGTAKTEGPSEIRFTGSLQEVILADPWIISEVPVYVASNTHYTSLKAKNPYTKVIKKMSHVLSKGTNFSELSYGTPSPAYLNMKEYVRNEGEELQDIVNTAIDFIVTDGAWEACYDATIREEAKNSGNEGEEVFDEVTMEWDRGVKKMKWCEEREEKGEFVNRDWSCRLGYRGPLKWEVMSQFLKMAAKAGQASEKKVGGEESEVD